uniref:Putative scarecrow-like protein 9 n=1 Tax=Davidia involucrata TaxID=16924 RepID=A0A5B6Z9H7_DAVIN
MDSLIRGFSGCKNGFKFDHVSVPGYTDRNDVNGFKFKGTPFDHDTALDLPFVPNDPDSKSCDPSSPKSLVEDSTKHDFSDAVLKYINKVLMEDDLEDKACMIQDSALHAAEKSFYDILGEKYPSSSKQPFLYQNINCSDDIVTRCSNYRSNSCVNANSLAKSGLCCDLVKYKSFHVQSPPVDSAFLPDSLSFCPLRSSSETVDGLVNSVVNAPLEIQSVLQFEGGIEEPREFLTSGNYEIFYLENNRLDLLGPKQKLSEVEAKAEKNERDLSTSLLWGRKNLHQEESYLEDARSKKHLAVSIEESALLEMFCKALLFNGGNDEPTIYNLDEPLQNGTSKELQQNL